MKLTSSLLLALVLSLSFMAQAQTKPASREEFRAALQACETENGLTRPVRGERPSEEDREILEACLEKKGYTKLAEGDRPHRGGHGRRGKFREPVRTQDETASENSGEISDSTTVQ